jgi:hypothetical protein
LNKEEILLEALSSRIHIAWLDWSQDITKSETISKERLDRWRSLWIPYSQLPESEKEKDREIARDLRKLVKIALPCEDFPA